MDKSRLWARGLVLAAYCPRGLIALTSATPAGAVKVVSPRRTPSSEMANRRVPVCPIPEVMVGTAYPQYCAGGPAMAVNTKVYPLFSPVERTLSVRVFDPNEVRSV